MGVFVYFPLPLLFPATIDEFPAVFVAAACARGETRITGAEELRVKESDRIATMCDGLRRLGVSAIAMADGARILGGRLQGGVVDAHGDVLHFSGRTGRYIEPSPGAPTLNLNSLVHRDLRLDVGSALTRAIAQGRRVEMPRMVIRQDDQSYGVTIVVEPIGDEKVRNRGMVADNAAGWGGGRINLPGQQYAVYRPDVPPTLELRLSARRS